MVNSNEKKTILNTNDIIQYYELQELSGQIKLFFRKSDIKSRNSNLNKPYYIVKPLVVKIGEIFDDHPGFSIFLKPKYIYRMNLTDADMWLMIIDDEQKTFKNDKGKDINFYEISLKYITNQKLIDNIYKKALSINNIEEFDDDEI